nr:uncharacterized protein LOC112029844 [Quercus suber]POF03056.1 hypothetical protein CFP56_69020 [Quercus suber]
MSTRWFIFLSILCVTAFRFYIFDLLVTNNSPILPKFRVDSVSVSNFSYFDSNSSVTGNWNTRFSIYNPNNWMTISYETSLFHASGFNSETRIPAFNQSRLSQTFVDAAFATRDDYVDRGALRDINVDGTPGSITFNVMLVTGFKFTATGSGQVVDLGSDYITVWCEGLVVSLSPSYSSASGSGKLVKPRDCDVF